MGFLILTACNNNEKNETITKDLTVHNIKDYVIRNMSEVDYRKYVKIEKEESKIQFYNNSSNLKYKITFRNITDKNLNIFARLYIPRELTKSIIIGNTEFGMEKEKNRYFSIEPGKGVGFRVGVLMKNYSDLTKREKEVFNKFKNKLYLEMSINGKKIYEKIDLKD